MNEEVVLQQARNTFYATFMFHLLQSIAFYYFFVGIFKAIPNSLS